MTEARDQLSPVNNMLSAANGQILLHLTQDIVLGIFLLTSTQKGLDEFNDWFKKTKVVEPARGPVSADELEKMLLTYHLADNDNRETALLAQKIMETGFKQATLYGLTFSIFDVPYVSPKIREKLKQKVIHSANWESKWKDKVSDKIAETCGLNI